MVAAFKDIYTVEINKLISTLEQFNNTEFTETKDFETKDKDCVSIQSICNHILNSGISYNNYIRSIIDLEHFSYYEVPKTASEAILLLQNLLKKSSSTLDYVSKYSTSEIESWKMLTSWKVTYDFEQMMEHALMHIIRHHRQIKILENK